MFIKCLLILILLIQIFFIFHVTHNMDSTVFRTIVRVCPRSFVIAVWIQLPKTLFHGLYRNWTSVNVHTLVYLCLMCKEEPLENKRAMYRLNSPRWTSALRNQSPGSRWPETANQWSAQRSCHGKCGWTSLLTNQRKCH